MSEDAFGRVGAGVLEACGSSAQTSSGRLPCRRTGRKCGGDIGLLRVGGGESSSAGRAAALAAAARPWYVPRASAAYSSVIVGV